MWMLHEGKLLTWSREEIVYVNDTWSETIKYEVERKLFMWMLHEGKLLTWSREEIVYVYDTWSESINMKSRVNCLCKCYMKWNY
jgi:hypothetical protein